MMFGGHNGGLRQQKSFVAGLLVVVALSVLSLTSKLKFDIPDGGGHHRQLRFIEEIVDGDNVPVDIKAAIDNLVDLKNFLGENLDVESHYAFDDEIRSLMAHQEALQDYQSDQHSRGIGDECDDICESKRELVRNTKEDIADIREANRARRKAARKAARVLIRQQARQQGRWDELLMRKITRIHERRQQNREIAVANRKNERMVKAAEDWCTCTGEGNEMQCSLTGGRSCSSGDACFGTDEVKYGDWSNICKKKDMCTCTGNGSEMQCSVTGGRFCSPADECFGTGSEYGDWSNICRAKRNMCTCTGNGNEMQCSVTGGRFCSSADECFGTGSEYGDWSNICRAKR